MELEKYETLEKIGHGSFGIIRKVRRKDDGYILCRKEVNYNRMSTKEREQLHAELSILKSLRHENIVQYYEREHIKSSQELHIYMEYCEQGDLGKRIRELKQANQLASEDFVWGVFTQVICGLYRCHYGEDPPPVGSNVVGLSNDARPLRSKAAHNTILHRDLKPENIFLGADASCKLGDFGLSKLLSSHEMASTYVGTPFYMSPELCLGESYNAHSDIWAFGCIMYELCVKAPPFNARSHVELVSKIRAGKIDNPISNHYSSELRNIISNCLRLNPLTRPDAAQLLNLPSVKLKRKELDVVAIGKQAKAKEEQMERKLRAVEKRLAEVTAEKQKFQVELEHQVRREWEVKARLEIDRQIQIATDQLYQTFEAQVEARVAETLKDHEQPFVRSSTPELTDAPHHHNDNDDMHDHRSEILDLQGAAELGGLSLESPVDRRKFLKKQTRTPFARAQTMIEGPLDSPMDIQMAEPSPAPIASLGLSPRRNASKKKPSSLRRNIFDTDFSQVDSADDQANSPVADDSDDDTMHLVPSPTRPRAPINGDPFKPLPGRRPSMPRQKTTSATLQTSLHPPLFSGAKHPLPKPPSGSETATSSSQVNATSVPPASPPKFSRPGSRDPSKSPSRRLSKLPAASSTVTIMEGSTSPTRRAPGSPTRPIQSQPNLLGQAGRLQPKKQEGDIRTAALLNHAVQGRTLVELNNAQKNGVSTHDFAAASDQSQRKQIKSRRDEAPYWDPEQDEMPSPFLTRGKFANHLPGALGGPGMRHLR